MVNFGSYMSPIRKEVTNVTAAFAFPVDTSHVDGWSGAQASCRVEALPFKVLPENT